jgi:hypothetical protein
MLAARQRPLFASLFSEETLANVAIGNLDTFYQALLLLASSTIFSAICAGTSS